TSPFSKLCKARKATLACRASFSRDQLSSPRAARTCSGESGEGSAMRFPILKSALLMHYTSILCKKLLPVRKVGLSQGMTDHETDVFTQPCLSYPRRSAGAGGQPARARCGCRDGQRSFRAHACTAVRIYSVPALSREGSPNRQTARDRL